MKHDKASPGKKPGIKSTLEAIFSRKKNTFGGYVLLLTLYIIASVIVSSVAGSKSVIMIGDSPLSVYAFAGVFSSLSNICLILMAVYFGRLGFFTSLALALFQIPIMLGGILFRHNMNSLPGIFGEMLTLIAIVIIYLSNQKINKYQERLQYQAVTDMLTGLPNRFATSELLNELIRREERFAVVSIDLNGFKSINETMGFETGNKVLKEIANRWKTIADTGISGTSDFVARISGDEFALILREYHNDADIMKTIVQYESSLNSRLTIDGCDFYINASFGYAEFPVDARTMDSLISYADAAMQEIKRAHSSDHILRFRPELLKIEHTLEIERKIRTALENNTFTFQLQPQFDMTHKLRGFEALARMKDEEGNLISPGEFIPVAEKVGLIDKVDARVFRNAATFFGELLRKTGADITLSVNVSVRHLMKNDFLDEVRRILRESRIPADHLEIEITESIMIDSAEKALECIQELKNMGILIAIDDFGTGYSSLSYLNHFPANLLKIDKSFIDTMNTSNSAKQYVAAIISMGHIMSFHVISEGVETQEQLETLRSIGCDYIQGFLWGRPLSQEAAAELVSQSVQA